MMDKKRMMLRMKLILILSLIVGLFSTRVCAEESQVLKEKMDRVSYATGVGMGKNLKGQGIAFDIDLVIRGFRDAFTGQKLLLTDEEIHAIINSFQTEMRRKQIETRHKQAKGATDNKKAGEAFLAENKVKEGVVSLPSGLQYKVLTEGSGKTPKFEDTVVVHYKGSLIDGTDFDSSYKRGQPATFQVKGVIKGWTEALQLMREGSKWQLFIPSELAYGTRGSGRIPPNSTLVFEVELISIK